MLRRGVKSIMSLSTSTSSSEDKRWNRLATTMDRFHQYFKYEFDRIYKLADGSFSKEMSLPMFMREADQLKRHLEGHHTIEERYFFPLLAKRMPSFAEDDQHRKSHEGIHEGLDRLSALTHAVRSDLTSYSPEKMRECLDSFRGVLMRHLDEEVHDLSKETMQKYWTLEEIDEFPL